MTPTQRAAMEQALKALKPIAAGNINSVISDAAYAAATSLIAALAEPAPGQEAAWLPMDTAQAQQQAPMQMHVRGVVLRDGLPTLIRDNEAKPTDQRLFTAPQAQQPAVEPSFAQRQQFLDGLAHCYGSYSRHEFLKVWIRDWTFHKASKAQQQPAPPAAVPMLTEDEVEAVQEGIAVDDFAHDLVRRTERLVRQKAGLQ